MISSAEKVIAGIPNDYTITQNPADLEVQRANAALIKESPALLSALTEYFRVFDDDNTSDAEMKYWLDNKWMPSARALIAKAEG